jgi:hypothetical protein
VAGDWMKVELELPEKPEVHYIANALNLEPDAVVGKLFRVWAWFNKHTENGNAHGVTFALLDRLTGVTGFGEVMCFAGWLEQRDKTLHMPKFDRHTSESAKKRALTSERQSRFRNADSVTKTLPEKRREEKEHIRAFALPDWVPQDEWNGYVDMRKKSKKPFTDLAKDLALKKLAKFHAEGYDLKAVLEASVFNGWPGLYPPKQDAQRPGGFVV